MKKGGGRGREDFVKGQLLIFGIVFITVTARGFVKGQLTALGARILETEVFFQIRKIDDFA